MKQFYFLLQSVCMGFFLFLQLCFSQSDSLVDCIPLSIGNQWLFNFDHWRGDALEPGSIVTTDTGTALYTIVNNTQYPDSVLWTFRVNRILHRLAVYQDGSTIDSTIIDSTILDSSSFVVVELLSGRHELFRQTSGDPYSLLEYNSGVCWNSIIPYQRDMPDSAKMYRYQIVDSMSITSFFLKYLELGIELDIALKKDSGLTSLFVNSTITMWFEHTHHYLISQIISDVQDHHPDDIPRSIHLAQNYPNPFNPSTTVNYQLPTQSHVTLKVFDVLGREVATLVNGVEEPGYKSVSFNVGATHKSSLPSGVYFYRLTAGNFVQTNKLVLIR